MKEDSGDGCGDSDVAPAGAIIQSDREHRKRGDAVERDRDSEPEKRHRVRCKAVLIAMLVAKVKLYRFAGWRGRACYGSNCDLCARWRCEAFQMLVLYVWERWFSELVLSAVSWLIVLADLFL